ncbi:MAG: ribosomal protein L7/L12 [Chloroflexi bacterium]|nr:ribosomal protein L7/L12 [Chloroflexota bacterium]
MHVEKSMEIKMETLNCPSCASSDLDQLGLTEYKCPHCDTSFMLTNTQTGFVDVVLVQAGKKNIKVTLALREITTKETVLEMMDLARAKHLTNATPCVVAPNVPVEVGERVKARLEKAGATVELEPA